MDLAWMYWTWPTIAFFVALAVALTFMTILDIRSPSVKHRGFLPIPFTRGERFFISVVLFFAVLFLWLALTDTSIWYAVAIAVVLDVIVARYG